MVDVKVIIPKILQDYKEHPSSSYHLAVLEKYLKDALKTSKTDKIKGKTKSKELYSALQTVLQEFKSEKAEYTEIQKKGFLERKIHIDNLLKKLEKQCS